MDGAMVGTIATVATPLVAVIYWVSRLEGRIDAQEQRHKAMQEDLHYIRDRIDRALGSK
jgi:hypothetical protein